MRLTAPHCPMSMTYLQGITPSPAHYRAWGMHLFDGRHCDYVASTAHARCMSMYTQRDNAMIIATRFHCVIRCAYIARMNDKDIITRALRAMDNPTLRSSYLVWSDAPNRAGGLGGSRPPTIVWDGKAMGIMGEFLSQAFLSQLSRGGNFLSRMGELLNTQKNVHPGRPPGAPRAPHPQGGAPWGVHFGAPKTPLFGGYFGALKRAPGIYQIC